MTNLFPYQREGVDRIKKLNGTTLLADSMGLGKTIQALTYLKEVPEARPAIVICPACVKYEWEKQAFLHCGLRAAVLEGFRRKPSGRRFDLYIANFDILADQRRENGGRKGQWEFLRDLNPNTIIVDECQAVKNRRAKRSKAIRLLCQGIPHRLFLSGTPLVNRPAELFNAISLLWPKEFPSFFAYARSYCDPKRTFFGWDFSGSNDLIGLHNRLKKLGMIRRKKWQVLQDLPKKSRHVVPVPIERPQEYETAKKDFLKWLRKINPQKAKRAEKAKILTQMGYLKRLAASLKLKAVMEWVDSFLKESDGKLVLFGIHREIIGQLYDHYRKSCVLVDGSVSSLKRRVAVERFQKDKRIRLFIGNIQAAGVGITLTAASTVAFAELGWTPGEMLQAEDRTHRISQVNPVQVFYLVAKNTIEVKLAELLESKMQVISQTLDGKKTKELNIYKQMITYLQDKHN